MCQQEGTGITKCPKRKSDGKNNNKKIIQHKTKQKNGRYVQPPSAKEPGFCFSVTQNQRCALLDGGWGWGHRWSWCQPVWGETFILRREKCTVSHPWGLGPRADLPAALLLPDDKEGPSLIERTRHYG